MKKIINSDKAPQPIGPYSQAIITEGKLIFVSEQIPLKADGTLAGDSIESQTHQVIKNIEAILKEAGTSLGDVVKTMIFVKDLSDFNTINKIYNEYFENSKPARGVVEVSGIPKNVLIGMEAIAVVS